MAVAALALAASNLAAQPAPVEQSASFADLADLALAAPITAHVRIAKADRLGPRETANVPPGHQRFFVEARLVALIRGPAEVPVRVRYLVDLPDVGGGPARLTKRSEHLIFAAPGPRPGELRLIVRDAQIAWTPSAAASVRALLAEAQTPAAPARVTGIGRVFHVPGSLAGESETRIFLATASGRPISLAVRRRPGVGPSWSAALGDFVDEPAQVPPVSLIWYRLACGLPAALPPSALADAEAAEARIAAEDYRFVREAIGACARTRSRISR